MKTRKSAVKIAWVLLLIVLAGICLSACEIQTPEQAAQEAAAIQRSQAEALQSEDPQPSGTETPEESSVKPSGTDTEVESAAPSASESAEDEYIDSDYVDEHYGDRVSESDYDKYEGGEVSEYTAGGKDQYLTDPVPPGKPKPVEWQDAEIDTSVVWTCTLSINCSTILGNMDKFNMDKIDVLPSDGVILPETQVTFYKGESVFDVLLRETQKNRIQMEYEMTPIYNSNYIEGIHNLYEFDCGELSGWMYKVNGWFPNYGCSRYQLQNGDVVNWVYTCDLGRDIGNEWLGETQ